MVWLVCCVLYTKYFILCIDFFYPSPSSSSDPHHHHNSDLSPDLNSHLSPDIQIDQSIKTHSSLSSPPLYNTTTANIINNHLPFTKTSNADTYATDSNTNANNTNNNSSNNNSYDNYYEINPQNYDPQNYDPLPQKLNNPIPLRTSIFSTITTYFSSKSVSPGKSVLYTVFCIL